MNKEKIYQQALELYGDKLQFNAMIEELLELLLNLHHFKKGKVTPEDVLEEMVDVTIMIEQMRLLFDKNGDWESIEQNKLLKLSSHLAQKKYTEV